MKFWYLILTILFGTHEPAQTHLTVHSAKGKTYPLMYAQLCRKGECGDAKPLAGTLTLNVAHDQTLRLTGESNCGTHAVERGDYRSGETIFLGVSDGDTPYGCFAIIIDVVIIEE